MQPTEHEIELEKETLRDIRRRSIAQVASVDLDLPIASSSAVGSENSDLDSTIDPSHLFWVPAHVHPELAPGEFRAFLKDHANLQRSQSSGSGLGRKRSMLSRQYKPSLNDNIEAENITPVSLRRRSTYRGETPSMTIGQLQNLEQLAEEASKSDDPAQLRTVLRRSLSLNVTSLASDSDEQDSPIIPQRPGQILRRAARTKIRKPGMSSEGSHTFQASRRGGNIPPPPPLSTEVPKLEEPLADRPLSFSEESSIFESYAHDDDEPSVAVVEFPPPDAPIPITEIPVEPAFSVTKPSQHHTPLRHPTPQRPSVQQQLLAPSLQTFRSPSPPQVSPQTPPQPQQPIVSPARKEKEKKGGLFGFSKKVKDRDGAYKDPRVEKEKDTGFFGSIFGGSKKKHEDQSLLHGSSGQAAAAALLGTSKSKASSTSPSPSPSPVPPHLMAGGPYARYPIHVERAVYRLSHIKLANPRRPLLEQVLISNLMFWYLGIINKAQANNGAQATTNGGPISPAENSKELADRNEDGSEKLEKMREQKEKELAEAEARDREAREREERDREAREKEVREKDLRKESGRRGSLTKPNAILPSGGRRAEMPVRGPQYDLQHRVMEQEYRPQGIGVNIHPGRNSTSPLPAAVRQPSPPGVQASYHLPSSLQRNPQPYIQPESGLNQQQLAYMQPQYYYGGGDPSFAPNGIAIGPLLDASHPAWGSGYPPIQPSTGQPFYEDPQNSTFSFNRSYPPQHQQQRRSKSPPPRERSPSPPSAALSGKHHSSPIPYGSSGPSRPSSAGSNSSQNTNPHTGARLQGRSLSATAVMTNQARELDHNRSPPGPGRLKKKSSTASARIPEPNDIYGGTVEEEDVPLAVWQEQQQQKHRTGRR